MPERYDFIVVGAGPGGSFTARVLAGRGFDTLLLERERLPRGKPCGGWVTCKAWNMLGWSDDRIENYVFEGAVVYDPLLRSIPISLAHGDRAISRAEFDYGITEDAVDAGAVLKDSEGAKRITRSGEGVTVGTASGEYRAKAVVGAEGIASFTGRQLGLRDRFRPRENMFTYSKEIRLTERQRNDIDLTFPGYSHMFMTDYAIGYGWLSQRGDWINIGIGHPAWLLNSREERLLLWKRFSRDLGKAFNIDSGHSGILEKPRAYSYPSICGPTEPTYGERVILVGDAAGFSMNFTGEGIGPAMTTGKMAAAVLETAYGNDDFSAGALSRFEELWGHAMRTSFKSTYDFLCGYIFFDRLRRWFNHNALDFLDIFMKDPELDEHLKMILAPDSNKAEAFGVVERDIPKALFRLAKMKIR